MLNTVYIRLYSSSFPLAVFTPWQGFSVRQLVTPGSTLSLICGAAAQPKYATVYSAGEVESQGKQGLMRSIEYPSQASKVCSQEFLSFFYFKGLVPVLT